MLLNPTCEVFQIQIVDIRYSAEVVAVSAGLFVKLWAQG